MFRIALAILFVAIGSVVVYTHGREVDEPSHRDTAVEYHRVKLDAQIPDLRFNGTPLDQVIDELRRRRTGANLIVDWRALERAGVARGVPVTLRLHPQPLHGALQVILRKAGPPTTEPGKH